MARKTVLRTDLEGLIEEFAAAKRQIIFTYETLAPYILKAVAENRNRDFFDLEISVEKALELGLFRIVDKDLKNFKDTQPYVDALSETIDFLGRANVLGFDERRGFYIPSRRKATAMAIIGELEKTYAEPHFNDKSPSNHLGDLLRVGPLKPLGSVPTDLIKVVCKVDPDEVITYLRNKGLKVIKTDEKETGRREAIYAYHKAALQELLDGNQKILLAAKWPLLADKYVESIASITVKDAPLYNLIADSFADYGSHKRTGKSDLPTLSKRSSLSKF